MPELFVFLIGLAVTIVVSIAILSIAAQDVIDRVEKGESIDSRFERWLIRLVSGVRVHSSSPPSDFMKGE